jgi:hypothetical protein
MNVPRLTYTEQGVHLDGPDTVEGRAEGTRELLDNLGSFLKGTEGARDARTAGDPSDTPERVDFTGTA